MRQEGPDSRGFCVPQCVWFKCGKNVLQVRGNTLWCNYFEDVCVGPRCPFAICIRNKMLPDNRCGLVVRRVTADTIRPDDFKLDIKIRGKMARRLGNDRDLV